MPKNTESEDYDKNPIGASGMVLASESTDDLHDPAVESEDERHDDKWETMNTTSPMDSCDLVFKHRYEEDVRTASGEESATDNHSGNSKCVTCDKPRWCLSCSVVMRLKLGLVRFGEYVMTLAA